MTGGTPPRTCYTKLNFDFPYVRFLSLRRDTYMFLAGDLNNVPLMSLDNFDMSRIITDMEVLKSQMKIIQEAQKTALSAHVALCRETRDATERSTSTPVRAVHSPVTSPIQQVVTTSPVEQRSTNDNNGTASSDDDNGRHHVTTEDDADADILRLAQTQGLIPDQSLRTPRLQLVPRTVRQPEVQLDENPLAEPTTSETSYASAVRRSPPPPPPPPPNQTNHNGRPYHNDRRPRDVNGHGRADGRAGGPGADNRARNAQNGRGNNNNNGLFTGNGEYFALRAAQQIQRKKKQRVGLFSIPGTA